MKQHPKEIDGHQNELKKHLKEMEEHPKEIDCHLNELKKHWKDLK